MTDESSFIVSSMYDLLNPDGVNVIELGSGKYQLMRPAALSNLHNIAFRSFTGDLLPFTTIELPRLKAELVMMTNGLKTVTLSGQDTMDLAAVNTYDNTKQNVILSLDKAWVYNKDAESQVIYNIEEIIELMNERLKDYFVNVGNKTVYHDANISTAYINNYKQLISKDDYNNVNDFCSIMYNAYYDTYKYYIPSITSGKILEMNEVYNSSISIPSGYDKIVKTFFDPISNCGFIVYENTRLNTIKVDAIRYDSSNSRYAQEEVETFDKPTNADVRILDKDHPTEPLHFFANGNILNNRTIGYVYVKPNAAAPTHPTIKFTYYLVSTRYKPQGIDIYSYLTSSTTVGPIFADHNVLHVYGIDIKTDANIHLIASKLNNNVNDLVYGITVTLPSFILNSSGPSFSGTPSVSVDWSCTLEQYMNQSVFKSIRYNFTDITRFNEVNNDAVMILPNNCYIQKSGFRYVYYGHNIFNYNSSNSLACKCFDAGSNDCYIASLANVNSNSIDSLYNGVNDFILASNSSLDGLVNFGKNNLIAVVRNDNRDYFPVYSYNLITALQEEYFNTAQTPNSTYLLTMNVLNVTCTAKDNNNANIALNPPNGGVLCSNLSDLIKLDSLTVNENNVLSGLITIPQIEFDKGFVLNFNLKVYSDPYYFNLYTLRDFTQQGHAYNLDVNHTSLYYRASNINVLDILEYLILLKYNYNLVKLRVFGFPNSDGIVFNLNENSYVSFKNMPTDNTMNSLIVELISDDNEELPSSVLQQLFGKISLAIDWMQ